MQTIKAPKLIAQHAGFDILWGPVNAGYFLKRTWESVRPFGPFKTPKGMLEFINQYNKQVERTNS